MIGGLVQSSRKLDNFRAHTLAPALSSFHIRLLLGSPSSAPCSAGESFASSACPSFATPRRPQLPRRPSLPRRPQQPMEQTGPPDAEDPGERRATIARAFECLPNAHLGPPPGSVVNRVSGNVVLLIRGTPLVEADQRPGFFEDRDDLNQLEQADGVVRPAANIKCLPRDLMNVFLGATKACTRSSTNRMSRTCLPSP